MAVSDDIVDNVQLGMTLTKDSSVRAPAPKGASQPLMDAKLSMAVNPAETTQANRRRRQTNVDNSLILYMGEFSVSQKDHILVEIEMEIIIAFFNIMMLNPKMFIVFSQTGKTL